MIYSRFVPAKGIYQYFDVPGEDRPINADLPVPAMPRVVNGIGAPAIFAGRPLPAGARLVGAGFHARGMVAAPTNAPLDDATLPTSSEAVAWVKGGGWAWIAGGLVAVALWRTL